ncbi:hypothetical protein AVEN_257543-1 [Araneus ventricosus]|uniref:Uncharacterized protein n=1 Tax=Araneus ventricosus TaxID=182803 RepID=A0A4Y2QM36_ARAVE|nr:hypothetical protein AVEN_257543-1 [Araneus ventricosus]
MDSNIPTLSQPAILLKDIYDPSLIPLRRSISNPSICSTESVDCPIIRIKDEECNVNQLISRIRNVINAKKSGKPYLTISKMDRGNALLDLLEKKIQVTTSSSDKVLPPSPKAQREDLVNVEVQTSPIKASAQNQIPAQSTSRETMRDPHRRPQTFTQQQSQVHISPIKPHATNTGSLDNTSIQGKAQYPQQLVSYADKARGKPSKPQTILLYTNEGTKEDDISNILRKEKGNHQIPIKTSANREQAAVAAIPGKTSVQIEEIEADRTSKQQ